MTKLWFLLLELFFFCNVYPTVRILAKVMLTFRSPLIFSSWSTWRSYQQLFILTSIPAARIHQKWRAHQRGTNCQNKPLLLFSQWDWRQHEMIIFIRVYNMHNFYRCVYFSSVILTFVTFCCREIWAQHETLCWFRSHEITGFWFSNQSLKQKDVFSLIVVRENNWDHQDFICDWSFLEEVK